MTGWQRRDMALVLGLAVLTFVLVFAASWWHLDPLGWIAGLVGR